MDAEQFNALHLQLALIERWAFYLLTVALIACGWAIWRAFHHYRPFNLGERMPR